MFPTIASGRKSFRFFENRITKNLNLANKYQKKNNNQTLK